MGAPKWPPYPPFLLAPRQSRGAPRASSQVMGAPTSPPISPRAPAKPWRASSIVAAHGGPDIPPPFLLAPRQSRGAPRSTAGDGPRNGPAAPWHPRLPLRGDCERDALRRHRQLSQPHAGRVLNRVGDGGRRRNDRRLADAARAERSGRRRLLHDDGLDVRQVGGGELA